MLDVDTRAAILRLAQAEHGLRFIARTLRISRNSVRKVLESGQVKVPPIERTESCAEHLDRIRALYKDCDGNLVRVCEKLEDEKICIPYPTLTAFCRRHGIGVEVKEPSGTYTFDPGEEMQHDTSPHEVKIGGHPRLVQCASLVLCYSRMIFAQAYPTFNRFYCKVFLTDALQFLGGVAKTCMIDNTHVVVAYGTGEDMVPAPEMAAFAERFGFKWRAHRKGDANRSGRVERPFDYIERNFYSGRSFTDLDDLNRQFRAWCQKSNGELKQRLHARPVELFAAEKPSLKALPPYIPEVYALHWRDVDSAARVSLHRNRYFVAARLIGERVEIRESLNEVRILFRHEVIATHPRLPDGSQGDSVLPEQRSEMRGHRKEHPALPEELALRAAAPELAALVDLLRKTPGRSAERIKRLHAMYLDYPTEPLVAGVRTALQYGQSDLGRIDRIVLRNIAGDYFQIPLTETADE